MQKIQVLPEILASQVAAGEVVERPASVVKELVENSIDAGATHIVIEIQKGGTALIKVTDNGSGMGHDDALLSLERHATSKLRSSDELMHIMTMGFRGEAVPSIASVSRFRLSTQESGKLEGTEVTVDGGTIKEVKTAGLSDGTVVEAKQLFFNVPARRKFLKADTTESAHVEHQVRLHALSKPQVRFTFRKDGRVMFDLPATEDRRVRITGLMGQAVASSLLEVPTFEHQGMKVSGYLLPAEYSRKGKRQQFVFLNGRPVEDIAISRAIKDGYRGAIAEGMHPSAWLWIEMNPQMVDINVHPAKKEVRFQRPHEVRFLVSEAVELAHAPEQEKPPSGPKIVSRMDGSETSVRAIVAAHREPTKEALKNAERKEKVSISQDAVSQKSWDPSPHTSQPELIADPLKKRKKNVPRFVLLGVLHQKYILMQGEEGLVMLDPKSARQRIVYEHLVAQQGEIPVQGLLIPEVIELDAHDHDIVSRNRDHFLDAGIQLEAFGGTSFQVSSLPEHVKLDSPRVFITGLIDELIATQETKKGKTVAYELFAQQVASRASLNEPIELGMTDVLLEQLFACDLPYCDPGGEPTLVQIGMTELDKKFGNS